jgi:hypothetical protein
MRMRFVAVLLPLSLLVGGCSSSAGMARVRIGMWHDLGQERRDPDPTQPLGEELGAAAIADQPGGRAGEASAAEEAGSGALGAFLLWLSTGQGKEKHRTLPIVQVAGTFDEVVIFRWLANTLGLTK